MLTMDGTNLNRWSESYQILHRGSQKYNTLAQELGVQLQLFSFYVGLSVSIANGKCLWNYLIDLNQILHGNCLR